MSFIQVMLKMATFPQAEINVNVVIPHFKNVFVKGLAHLKGKKIKVPLSYVFTMEIILLVGCHEELDLSLFVF